MQPIEYLTLARELACRPDDEAALRSAVSRAYYAAYLAAKKFDISLGSAKGPARPAEELSEGAHERFWAELGCRLKLVGDRGNSMRKWRNRADYDLNYDPKGGWKWTATYWVGRAEEIFRLLEEAPAVAGRQRRVPFVRAGDKQRFPELDTHRSMPGPPEPV